MFQLKLSFDFMDYRQIAILPLILLSLCSAKVPINIWNNALSADQVHVLRFIKGIGETWIGSIDSDTIFRSQANHMDMLVFRKGMKRQYIRTVVVQRDEGCYWNSTNCDLSTNIIPVQSIAELKFRKSYKERFGIQWQTVYPRSLPVHPFLPIEAIGHVSTRSTKYIPMKSSILEDQSISKDESTHQLSLKTLQHSPHLILLEDFLSAEECAYLIKYLERNKAMQKSTLGDKIESPVRKSENQWIQFSATAVTENIAKRIFDLVGIEYKRETAWKIAEQFQALHYDVGGFYAAHNDWFSNDRSSRELQSGRNRFATLFMYLNDVEEGGETAFPLVQGTRSGACSDEKSFKVKAKRGRAVLWYNMMPDGNLDTQALHTACPVLKGEKYAINTWIWDPFRLD